MFRRYKPVLLLSLLLCCCAHFVSAQKSASLWEKGQEGKQQAADAAGKKISRFKAWKDRLQQWGTDSVFNHSFSLGGRLNSDGWSGLAQYKHRRRPSQFHLFELRFSEIKHEKQVKQQQEIKAYAGQSTPFVFGKINNLYTLQLAYGREQVLFPALIDGHMSVSLQLQGGFSLAMLKPYYLRIVYTDPSNGSLFLAEEKYTEANREKFLSSGSILGNSGWTKGLDEMEYVPGAFADAAIAITPGRPKAFVQTVSFGVNASAYSKTLPVMAEQQAYRWNASLYVGLMLGKRW